MSDEAQRPPAGLPRAAQPLPEGDGTAWQGRREARATMSPRWAYLLLCLLGTLLPYWQFVPWLLAHGPDFPLFFRDLFANGVAGFFGLDVFVSTAALWTFVALEGRRLGVRHLWAPVVASLAVGVSLGLPLFLYLRQAQLERAAEPGAALDRGAR